MINTLVHTNVQTILDSMLYQQAVKVVGTTPRGHDCVIDVVIAVEVEDGSGNNFNVTFRNGIKLFVKANLAIVAWKAAYKI